MREQCSRNVAHGAHGAVRTLIILATIDVVNGRMVLPPITTKPARTTVVTEDSKYRVIAPVFGIPASQYHWLFCRSLLDSCPGVE